MVKISPGSSLLPDSGVAYRVFCNKCYVKTEFYVCFQISDYV